MAFEGRFQMRGRQPIAVVRNRVPVGVFLLVVLPWGLWVAGPTSAQGTDDDASLALYADASNFQNGGAYELAIESWNKFLKQYAEHERSAEAAHYLGVCYMQKDEPDHAAAAQAFAKALTNKSYELREESLANYGWCLYTAAGTENPDRNLLAKSLDAFATLQRENPKSAYLDRAFFYSGEAAYGLGDAAKAVRFYDALLALPSAKESPLRCDAFYARGVAQENLNQYGKAFASYKQLLASCDKPALITDVHLRMGDLHILQKQFAESLTSFQAAFDSAESDDDKAYAVFRKAFALVQSGRPGDAAEQYELLLQEFPDSPYTASAALASAQSSYRSGDLEKAARGFQQVMTQKNPEAATEAAHWLARIHISKGALPEAEQVCRQQIKNGIEGAYANSLAMDLAEVLSMDPSRVEQSLGMFEKIYRDSPEDALAPRALYNAAFSAMQIEQPRKALALALEFITKFPSDPLDPDVRFVAAESQLQLGQAEDAAETYRKLLSSSGPDNFQRPLWVLRGAACCNAAKQHEQALALLQADLPRMKEPAQKAEAMFLMGQAYLESEQGAKAVKAFQDSQRADPEWARAPEALLLAGQAQLVSGNANAASDTWNRLIKSLPDNRSADQARYKLAQLATNNGQFEKAAAHYRELLQSAKDPSLTPYALYGEGWSLVQLGKYERALESLDRMLRDSKQHPLRNDATLARGIALRNLERWDDAKADLEAFLAIPPKGMNLGHTLYELALIDQKQSQPGRAARRLERLVKEVPDYPSMDKVLYELGWSHRENGNQEAAVTRFNDLVSKFGKTPLAAEAAYFLGQHHYKSADWTAAAKQFDVAATFTDDAELSEKAYYRLGWSHFKAENFPAAETAFADQAKKHPSGKLSLDALMMVGECHFKTAQYDRALSAYTVAAKRIRDANENATTVRDPAERQVRELVLLHGGQSAAQLKKWDESISWLGELRSRFPATNYLPQAFYETGFAYQQTGNDEKALKFFAEVADNFRNEVAARARFMMGEIHFGNRKFDQAIEEFQRVMFGFDAEQAPPRIKNWQAKSGFEAGRCSELLMQEAKTKTSRAKASKYAVDFFTYVAEKHPQHELAPKSRERLEALKP